MTEHQLADFLKRGYTAQAAVERATTAHISDGMKAHHARRKAKSALEDLMYVQIINIGLPVPVRQHEAIAGRKYKLDFGWPERRIGLEVQGMVHRIKAQFQHDIERRAIHLLAGWRILEVDGAAVREGRALAWLVELLA